MTQYMCCKHCEPGCPSHNSHDLTCILGCLPYTANQQGDKEMSQPLSSEPPYYEKKQSPENVPAEALEETLEFERARWEEQREELVSQLSNLMDALSKMDSFMLDSVVNMGQALRSVQSDLISGEDAIKAIIGNFINEMPTPEKMDLEQHLSDEHFALDEVSRREDYLRGFLNEHGYDPDAIVEDGRTRDQDFLRTLLEGFGQQSADFDDEAPDA